MEFRTNGKFRVRVFCSGQNLAHQEHFMKDYVEVSGQDALRPIELLTTSASGFINERMRGGRTPISSVLELELTPSKQWPIRPRNKGSIILYLKHSGRYGVEADSYMTEIRAQKTDSSWRVKHAAWKFGCTTRPSSLLFYILNGKQLAELEDRHDLGFYGIESVESYESLERLKANGKQRQVIEVYTSKYLPPDAYVQASQESIWRIVQVTRPIPRKRVTQWDEDRKFTLHVSVENLGPSRFQAAQQPAPLKDVTKQTEASPLHDTTLSVLNQPNLAPASGQQGKQLDSISDKENATEESLIGSVLEIKRSVPKQPLPAPPSEGEGELLIDLGSSKSSSRAQASEKSLRALKDTLRQWRSPAPISEDKSVDLNSVKRGNIGKASEKSQRSTKGSLLPRWPLVSIPRDQPKASTSANSDRDNRGEKPLGAKLSSEGDRKASSWTQLLSF